MIKLINTTGGSLTANTNIPLVVKMKTNDKIDYDTTTNEIKFYKSGIYNIDVNVVITATSTGGSAIELYKDGVEIPETKVTQTIASGDTYTYIINDTERVLNTFNISDTAKLSIRPSVAGTLVRANVNISEIR